LLNGGGVKDCTLDGGGVDDGDAASYSS